MRPTPSTVTAGPVEYQRGTGNTMMRVLKNKRGTTLVELVVCMVLLSLFTLAAVTLIQPSAQAYMQVQQQTRAQNLADALIRDHPRASC